MSGVPAEEAALRAAWQEVCMTEYRITGDMVKATAFADRIDAIYRSNIRMVQTLSEAESMVMRRMAEEEGTR